MLIIIWPFFGFACVKWKIEIVSATCWLLGLTEILLQGIQKSRVIALTFALEYFIVLCKGTTLVYWNLEGKIKWSQENTRLTSCPIFVRYYYSLQIVIRIYSSQNNLKWNVARNTCILIIGYQQSSIRLYIESFNVHNSRLSFF